MTEISGKLSSIDRNKIFWSVLFTILLCITFWLLSRYPALDSKAIMEGETNFDGIGFSQIFSVSKEEPILNQIFFNTVNWLETNRQGMTFGVLFAASIMLIFSLLEGWKPKNRFVSSLVGAFIGFPLGVCVNCAAPIAQGVYKGGGRAETALSMMMSSPTLNVVVLTMTFTIFPFYIAFIKLCLSLLIVLLLVPLLTRYFFNPKVDTSIAESDLEKKNKSLTPFEADFKESLPTSGLLGGLSWFLKAYWKRLWYIVKMTVPLMILAGLLGNILIHFLPWEILGEIGRQNPLLQNLLIMFSIAIVGLLLPVPMTFDIIVVTVLMASGLSPLFATVLLVTLGSFSVYSFFIVWQTFQFRLALVLSITVIVLAVGGGLVAHKIGQVEAVKQMDTYRETLAGTNPKAPTVLSFPSSQTVFSCDNLQQVAQQNKLTPQPFKFYPEENVLVEQLKFKVKKESVETGISFQRITGKKLGLSVDLTYNIQQEFSQISQSSCISSGDIQNDGWQDLVIASINDVYLFINTGNREYLRQSFNVPELEGKSILTTVLLDLNNDDWLDLFIGTYQGGNYALLNEKGDLAAGELIALDDTLKPSITLAPAFADVDRNGTIDLYSGNWSVGMMGNRKRGFHSSINFLQTDPLDQATRKKKVLKGPTGETLSTLFTDFNNDGIQDLVVGNDFHMPELFYQGTEEGAFRLVTNNDGMVPITSQNCMSIAGVDLNNDLNLEYFMAGSASKDLPIEVFKEADDNVCEELIDPEERKQCEQIMKFHAKIVKFRSTQEINFCPNESREDCLVLDMLSESVKFLETAEIGHSRLCDFIPSDENWKFMKTICDFDRWDTVEYSQVEKQQAIPAVRNRNVLLQKTSSTTFSDVSQKFNLGITGWSWNAQFADLDNDQFSDVLVATGSFHDMKREPNHLYQNMKGEAFVERSKEGGIDSYLPSYSYVYTDFDNDGDLDIVMPPALAPIQFYENLTTGNNSIVIELKDAKGNRQGVGSKIKIYYGNGQQQIRELKASGGYRSFNPIEAWFGLRDFQTIDRISVQWSTGEIQELEGPFPVGSRYTIRRNSESSL